MRASVEGSVRCQPFRTPCPLACSQSFVALPLKHGRAVALWTVKDLSRQPWQFAATHCEAIAGLAISPEEDNLCSASQDSVLLWSLRHLSVARPECCPDAQLLFEQPGDVNNVSFNTNGRLVAMCSGCMVLIINVMTKCLEATLEGHLAPVSAAMFSDESTIISISHDRTFKVWNILKGCLVYQSSVLTASPLLSMTLHPHKLFLAMGSAEGKVWVFSHGQLEHDYRCVYESSVSGWLEKQHNKLQTVCQSEDAVTAISSLPSWSHPTHSSVVPDSNDHTEQVLPVLALRFAVLNEAEQKEEPPFPLGSQAQTHENIRDVLSSLDSLLVATSSALCQVNVNTAEMMSWVDLQGPLPYSFDVDGAQRVIPSAGTVCFACGQNSCQYWCVSGEMFQPSVTVLRVQCATNRQGQLAAEFSDSCDSAAESASLSTSGFSVLSEMPLLPKSILHSDLVPKTQSAKKPTKVAGHRSAHHGVQDQPLTFKSTVKSSGYGAASQQKMFKPRTTSFHKQTTDKASLGLQAHTTTTSAARLREYPITSAPPVNKCSSINLVDRPAAITTLSFSRNGDILGCGMANKAVLTIKSPITSSSKVLAYSGHDSAVLDIAWSLQHNRFLSVSADRTARLWCPSSSDPLMVFSRTLHNFPSSTESDKDNVPFLKEITHAAFYYMDKFIILVSGNSFYLYKYYLDLGKADDIKRYKSLTRYKLVKEFNIDSAQQITAFSTINSFYSYITLVGMSDRSLHVYDMNVGERLCLVKDVHSRAAHHICQNEGTPYVTHSQLAYDLFLTTAVSDGIKLWDLRTSRCVRRYGGHSQRAHRVHVAISPCARYIATGSEDKCVCRQIGKHSGSWYSYAGDKKICGNGVSVHGFELFDEALGITDKAFCDALQKYSTEIDVAYLYDLRSSTYLHRLHGHCDVVTDVAFHPQQPLLCTGGLDGKITIFKDQ